MLLIYLYHGELYSDPLTLGKVTCILGPPKRRAY